MLYTANTYLSRRAGPPAPRVLIPGVYSPGVRPELPVQNRPGTAVPGDAHAG